MANVVILEIEGAKELTAKLQKMNLMIQKETKTVLLEAGMKIQADAKKNAPVDTGRLKNSITTETYNGGFTVEVGTNVEYAIFAEYGTRYWSGKPFLQPAYDSNAEKIVKELERILNDACS